MRKSNLSLNPLRVAVARWLASTFGNHPRTLAIKEGKIG